MKLSEVQLTGQRINVQTKTDAWREMSTERSRQAYIEDYGDVEVVEKEGRPNWFEVPAFKAQIDRYVEAKAKDCAIWGCE